MEQEYFAGEAANVLGIEPITLRVWRDRGICNFGHVDDAMKDNPRARRRYSESDVVKMAFALTLARFGFSHEEAFSIADTRLEIKKAVIEVLTEHCADDLIFAFVAAGVSESRSADFSNSLFLRMQQWQRHAHTAFEAEDALRQHRTEVFLSINVSALARRVIKALRDGVED